jgi:hypothetical protein
MHMKDRDAWQHVQQYAFRHAWLPRTCRCMTPLQLPWLPMFFLTTAHRSVLKRAIHTMWRVLDAVDLAHLPGK